jgi:hypothetical protein
MDKTINWIYNVIRGECSMLKTFYAVTESGSLYEINSEKDENGWPIVRRIAHNRRFVTNSDYYLRRGDAVGITEHQGVCLVNTKTDHKRNFEMTNTTGWGGSTSRIVGLFLERAVAAACLRVTDYFPWDRRWRVQTRETLEAIGNSHPVFLIGALPAEVSIAA